MLKQRGLGYLAVRRCSHKRARASPHPFKLSILLPYLSLALVAFRRSHSHAVFKAPHFGRFRA